MTDKTTAELIEQARELEALDRARTQGEWRTYRVYDGAGMDVATPDTHPKSACEPPSDRDADAVFIAAAPRAFALLRQMAERLREAERDAARLRALLRADEFGFPGGVMGTFFWAATSGPWGRSTVTEKSFVGLTDALVRHWSRKDAAMSQETKP